MAMKLTFDDGFIQIIPKAVKVDSANYHEGMVDFYDERGNLVEQISMDKNFEWLLIDEPEDDFSQMIAH